MKKKTYWITIILTLLLSACSQRDDSMTKINLAQNVSEVLNEISLITLPYIKIPYRENRVTLVDLLTNETLVEFNIDNDVTMHSVQRLTNNHYGIFTVPKIEGSDSIVMVGGDDGVFFIAPDGSLIEAKSSFLLLDADLNLIQEFEISDKQLILGLSESTISHTDGHLVIYYAFNNNIYVYDLNDHETTLVAILEETALISQLELIIGDQLAFSGSSWENHRATYYGVINLETGETSLLRTDFPVTSMVVSEHYLVFPKNTNSISSSEIVLFNLTTEEERMFQLERYESMNATVIAGRYVLTGTYAHIRVYDIETNKIMLDAVPSKEMARIEANHDVEEIIPGIETFLRIYDGLYAVVFSVGDGTFHVDLIIIEEQR